MLCVRAEVLLVISEAICQIVKAFVKAVIGCGICCGCVAAFSPAGVSARDAGRGFIVVAVNTTMAARAGRSVVVCVAVWASAVISEAFAIAGSVVSGLVFHDWLL